MSDETMFTGPLAAGTPTPVGIKVTLVGCNDLQDFDIANVNGQLAEIASREEELDQQKEELRRARTQLVGKRTAFNNRCLAALRSHGLGNEGEWAVDPTVLVATRVK